LLGQTNPPEFISVSRIVGGRLVSEWDVWILRPVMGISSMHDISKHFGPVRQTLFREKADGCNDSSYSPHGKSSAREPNQNDLITLGVIIGEK
jgi:hypothetical protein